MAKVDLRSELTLFDVTNLVVGAIIGADIYVASSFGAGYLGPSSLVVWIIAGVMTIVIALCFSQCAAMLPRAGGPYAYTKEAWGPFAGFIIGWSLWLAEWISLAVFPVAFTRYLMFFLPDLGWMDQTIVKILFVTFLAISNILGTRAAGKTNDVLTIIKLAPLVFFVAVGLIHMIVDPVETVSNFSPFFPHGVQHFGEALVLIFWAYAGFEISTIPANEIREPSKTIPKAIVLGISIVTLFYLATNFVLFGVRPWSELASDTAPLASATTAMLSTNTTLMMIGGGVVGVGALFSVAGSDESGMIGTSRLAYALAVDGLFPNLFAKIHPKFQTPYLAIVVQAATALVASVMGNLGMLIASSVFFMAIAYLATSASIFHLKKNLERRSRLQGGPVIPILGIVFSLFLISQCTIVEITTGLTLLIVGIPIYVKYSPKREMAELKEALLSRDSLLRSAYRQEGRFLAHALRHLRRIYARIAGEREGGWHRREIDPTLS